MLRVCLKLFNLSFIHQLFSSVLCQAALSFIDEQQLLLRCPAAYTMLHEPRTMTLITLINQLQWLPDSIYGQFVNLVKI